ncbi:MULTISPECIES: Asp23/Gls24 family envelope stress response protein [Brevibacterium]
MSDDRRQVEDERAAPDLDAERAAPDLDSELRDVIDDYLGHYVPDPEQTAGIRERILQLVRNDLYRGPSTKLRTSEGHEYSIASAAVRTIIRSAVDTVDGIRSRSVGIAAAGEPSGSAAEVRLTVTMRADIRFVAAADLIRAAVSEALERELGVPAARIDIEVEDAYVE